MLLLSQNYKIKRLVADYPNEDIDERMFFANSLLRNLIRTDACFLIPLKIKKRHYQDEY